MRLTIKDRLPIWLITAPESRSGAWGGADAVAAAGAGVGVGCGVGAGATTEVVGEGEAAFAAEARLALYKNNPPTAPVTNTPIRKPFRADKK